MTEAIQNRYEFVLLFDVTNGNPNGDPDGGNLPRIDPETGHGITTDVCLKRKVRNYVDTVKENTPPYEIHVREGAFLSEHHKRAHLAIEKETIKKVVPEDLIDELRSFDAYPKGISFSEEGEHPILALELSHLEEAEKKTKSLEEKKNAADIENAKLISPAAKAVLRELFVDSKEKKAAQWMCKNFFDVRTFGAVMSTGDMRCGQVRGPVQLAFARSIDPVVALDISISRTAAVRVDKPDDKGLGARKSIVPYGLYRIHGYVSANLAKRTGFSEKDLALFWSALLDMFDQDAAAARTGMHTQRLIVFKHDSALGNAPARELFKLVDVHKNCGDQPPRKFSDYTVTIDEASRPEGVSIEVKL
jgi:CRISPR-associated protein Csd2